MLSLDQDGMMGKQKNMKEIKRVGDKEPDTMINSSFVIANSILIVVTNDEEK